jgi:hypothetical protein
MDVKQRVETLLTQNTGLGKMRLPQKQREHKEMTEKRGKETILKTGSDPWLNSIWPGTNSQF